MFKEKISVEKLFGSRHPFTVKANKWYIGKNFPETFCPQQMYKWGKEAISRGQPAFPERNRLLDFFMVCGQGWRKGPVPYRLDDSPVNLIDRGRQGEESHVNQMHVCRYHTNMWLDLVEKSRATKRASEDSCHTNDRSPRGGNKRRYDRLVSQVIRLSRETSFLIQFTSVDLL